MSQTKRSLPSWLPLAGGLLVAVLALILLWALVIDADDDASKTGDGPAIADAAGISDVADRVGHPVYWLGERAGTEYELTETESGRVYVRYLEDGAQAGDESDDFVTVGTYPAGNAVAAVRRAAKSRPNAELARADDGAVLMIDPDAPRSIFVAYPGSKEQIELYSPDPKQGLRIAVGDGLEKLQ